MDAKFKAFIIAGLRRMTYKWKPRYTVMNAAKIERGRYKCAICTKVHPRKEIALDHIQPVIDPMVGFVDWNTLIPRMFAEEEGWQVLCKPCHKAKSLHENKFRKMAKKCTLKTLRRKKKA